MAKSTSRRVRNYCAQCYTPSCDFRGPCRYPHGCCYSILGVMSAIGGIMMNYYVLGSCFFQRVQQVNHVTGDPIPGSERGYGFLSRETDYGLTSDYAQCTWYPQAEYDAIFDGWFRTGRVFAFLSAMLATICFSVLLLTCCMAFSTSMFERWLFWMYIVAALSIALSFFAFGNEWCSENDCKVADGSGWAISAFMFHLVSANTVKSFPGPSAPPSRNRGEDDDLADDELDDLYYEDEEFKYPPPHPDGPRGVLLNKNGEREYDNGEDYYDEMGRLIKDPRHMDSEYKDDPDDLDYDNLQEEDLDDISDHDLDEYDSDNDEEAVKYDEFGNPIFDPTATHGNMGVGYENNNAPVDEFGNPIQQVDEFGNPVAIDEFGSPVPQVDEYGNTLTTNEHANPTQVDEFGNSAQVDELGNPTQVDEFGNPIQVDEFGNPLQQMEQQYDEYGNPTLPSQLDNNESPSIV